MNNISYVSYSLDENRLFFYHGLFQKLWPIKGYWLAKLPVEYKVPIIAQLSS